MVKRYRRPEPVCRESFYVARRTAGLTIRQTAEFLGVTVRTVRYWEAGEVRIPYSAFKLLRMRSGGIVHVPGWEGWSFNRSGALFSPFGRSFRAAELYDMRMTFSMAQHFRDIYAKTAKSNEEARRGAPGGQVPAVPTLRLVSGGKS